MFTSLFVIAMSLGAGAAPPVFQATVTQSEKPLAGPLTGLASGWSAQVGDTEIAAGAWVELIQLGVARPNFPWDRPHLLMINGDRWPGRIISIKDDQVRFVPAFGTLPEITIPVSEIAVAWLKSPRAGAAPDATSFDLPSARRTRDEVYLVNQDTVTGTIVTLAGPELRIEQSGQSKTIAIDRVAAIAFNSDLARIKKPAGPTGHVVLTSGTRITLIEAQLQDGRIVGKTVGGIMVRFLLGDIVAISMRSESVVWLDHLKPLRYDHTPFSSTKWPVSIGHNSVGGAMKLGPHVFDFGIGLHSQSQVTYAIPPNVERFESWVGLDAEAGKQGNVRVNVMIDGQAVLGPIDIVGAGVPQRVSLPIPRAAKELTLSVEFGGGGDVQDRVNWGDARFIRSAAPATGKP